MLMTMLMTASLLAAATTPETTSLVNELASEPAFTSEAVGYSASRSNAYDLYERLIAVAFDDELRDLLGHRSPVVRLYAFQGLIARGFPAAPLVAKLEAKESLVEAQYGCSLMTARVGEIAKQIVEDHAARARSTP